MITKNKLFTPSKHVKTFESVWSALLKFTHFALNEYQHFLHHFQIKWNVDRNPYYFFKIRLLLWNICINMENSLTGKVWTHKLKYSFCYCLTLFFKLKLKNKKSYIEWLLWDVKWLIPRYTAAELYSTLIRGFPLYLYSGAAVSFVMPTGKICYTSSAKSVAWY